MTATLLERGHFHQPWSMIFPKSQHLLTGIARQSTLKKIVRPKNMKSGGQRQMIIARDFRAPGGRAYRFFRVRP
jgi:hypothetical protein